MDWTTILFITMGLLVVLLASGMRIAWALFVLGFIILFAFMSPDQGLMMGFQAWRGSKSFLLVAIPLFILMSQIIFQSGLSARIYGSLSPILDHLPGGLIHSNIVSGAFLAAATGSTIATTVTIGTVALPEMEKRGYDRTLTVGSIGASGILGNIIPPSIMMVIYGSMTDVSVGKLFIGGIFPGIILALLFMGYTGIRVGLQPHLAPRWTGGYVPWGKSLLGLLNVWPIVVLIIVVLGSIYGGIATPTEAAGVGCIGAAFIAAAYRRLNWKVIKEAAIETVKTTSMVMMIMVGAKLMAVPLMNMGVFGAFTNFIVDLPVPPLGILLSIILMYLVLGMFMSGLPVIVITLPIVFPIIMALGYDPVWFGLMTVLLDDAGLLTPPVGTVLYILHGLRPDGSFREVAWGCTQYFFMILVLMVILIIFPQIVTWLPNLMIGS